MPSSLKNLAKNIENELKKIERRPAWLSKKSAVSKGQISRILSGNTNPTLETVDQIAKALGVLPHQLIEVKE